MTPLRLLAAVLLCSPLFFTEGVEGWGGLSSVPSESECRPYIEKALKEQVPSDSPGNQAVDLTSSEIEGAPTVSADQEGSIEETEEATTKKSIEDKTSDEIKTENLEESLETEATTESGEQAGESTAESGEVSSGEVVEEKAESAEAQETTEEKSEEEGKAEESTETGEVLEEEGTGESIEEGDKSLEAGENLEVESTEATPETQDETTTAEEQSAEKPDEGTNEEKSAEEEIKEDTQLSSEQETDIKESEEAVEETKSEEVTPDVTASEESSTEVKPEETQEASDETPSEAVEASEEKPESTEDTATEESAEATGGEVTDSVEEVQPLETAKDSTETAETIEASPVEEVKESVEETVSSSDVPAEESAQTSAEEASQDESVQAGEAASTLSEEVVQDQVSNETAKESVETSGDVASESIEQAQPEVESTETNETAEVTSAEAQTSAEGETTGSGDEPTTEQEAPVEIAKEQEPTVEDQLTLEFETPKVRRSREHIAEILKLNPESAETELLLAKTIDSTLKELKRLYDAAIKPLEILYKYRDLSNRHFGDPEIFSKPLILFMGPWSGGKSTILNYLMDNEFKTSSLRTGAEPSPAYFNILMWGEREEVLDGTQLAADWTFSGLQKFGQGLLDRLRGLRLKNPLLEKVNIVEIPGILEIRKQVERLFPFNDACQWFIDRADIIFLVYDPSKLDVGPETEAILDQLKGREYQTRIILNKADQVKPEELMRVQGTLIWNISPLMSSMEPPVMYSTSLWSIPYEQGAPSRLLHAQERAFLRDLRTAIDKRVENKIASARRFAVRVRNHAKMVDCYLTTYYNHKTFFGNRKKVADEIIEHPQNYHIYEGLSTLTNISRYDLPDPEVYRDFFRLNSLYDFQRLSETCTFFRGCPINRLDVSIAYDLPELVGKYKKQAEKVLEQVAEKQSKS